MHHCMHLHICASHLELRSFYVRTVHNIFSTMSSEVSDGCSGYHATELPSSVAAEAPAAEGKKSSSQGVQTFRQLDSLPRSGGIT